MSEEISVEELMMMDTAAQLTTQTGIVVTVHKKLFRIGQALLTIDQLTALLCEAAEVEAMQVAIHENARA